VLKGRAETQVLRRRAEFRDAVGVAGFDQTEKGHTAMLGQMHGKDGYAGG
jgi:hypothetical protein